MGADLLQLCILTRFLCHDPGLLLVQILIGLVGKCHDLAHGAAELAIFKGLGNCRTAGDEMLKKGGIWQSRCQLSVESLIDKSGAAAGDIDDFADQVRVDPCCEIIKIEVDIFDSGVQFGCKIVAQIIRIKVVQVGARLDIGAP